MTPRISDWVGRDVRPLANIETGDGDEFTPADVLTVRSTWRGTFGLGNNRYGPEDKRTGVSRVRPRSLELLPLPFVFSIRPVHVAKFRLPPATRKGFELRTRVPSVKPGERHLIYETAPTSKIVAIATVGETIVGRPAIVWALTKDRCGVTRAEFDEYFDGRSRAVAIEMTMEWLEVPLALPPGMRAPQAWARWTGAWPL